MCGRETLVSPKKDQSHGRALKVNMNLLDQQKASAMQEGVFPKLSVRGSCGPLQQSVNEKERKHGLPVETAG